MIKNLSSRSAKYWIRAEEVYNERYKIYLVSTPVERISLTFVKDQETRKDEYSKVKAIIMEMILKAIPTELATEAAQKRYDDPIEVMMMIMTRYQPGSRSEKEALLQRITNPEMFWTEEQALPTLKM